MSFAFFFLFSFNMQGPSPLTEKWANATAQIARNDGGGVYNGRVRYNAQLNPF